MNKIDELRFVAEDIKPEFICLCETWTNDDILDAFLNLNGYTIACRKDRTDTMKGIGGGLIIYAKAGIIVSELRTEQINSYNQCCVISLNNDHEIMHIVLVYRPHNLYNENDVKENNRQL